MLIGEHYKIRPVDSQGNYFFTNVLNNVPPIPQEGVYYKYELQANPGSGLIQFWRDDLIIFNRTVSQWIGKTIRYASWTGEIDGRETDMPGTLGNKCELKQCKYKKNDGYLPWNANFGEASDIIGVTQQSGSRPDEWGIWVDTGGMTMKIWDVNPLQ